MLITVENTGVTIFQEKSETLSSQLLNKDNTDFPKLCYILQNNVDSSVVFTV
jgi:hypothetical protein